MLQATQRVSGVQCRRTANLVAPAGVIKRDAAFVMKSNQQGTCIGAFRLLIVCGVAASSYIIVLPASIKPAGTTLTPVLLHVALRLPHRPFVRPTYSAPAPKVQHAVSRRQVTVRASAGDEQRPKVEFGYSRKDIVIIGGGLIGLGYAMYYGLQAGGMEAGMAGNWVQLTIFMGICVGWVGSYVYRVGTKVGTVMPGAWLDPGPAGSRTLLRAARQEQATRQHAYHPSEPVRSSSALVTS